MLESLLKSTMEEVTRMLEVEALNGNEKRNLEDRLRETEKKLATQISQAEEEVKHLYVCLGILLEPG